MNKQGQMPAPNERFTFGEIAYAKLAQGGSNSAENDVRTRTAVARRTFSESRRFAKLPSLYRAINTNNSILI